MIRRYYIVFLLLFASFLSFGKKYAANSVLSSGNWIKVKTTSSGIHKLTFSQLKSMGISNPTDVRVYGNGGYGLPFMNNEYYPDDLAPVKLLKGKDGNGNDCVWFYVSGPVNITYNESRSLLEHKKNLYSDEAYYYISDNAGVVNNIIKAPEESKAATDTSKTYDDFMFYDEDQHNLLESGRRFFGQLFSGTNSKTFSFDFNDVVFDEKVYAEVVAVSRSFEPSLMNITVGDVKQSTLNFSKVSSSGTSIYAVERKSSFSFNPSSAKIDVKLSFSSNKISEKCWLDYIRVNARRKLDFKENQLVFRDARNSGVGKVLRYEISNATATTKVLDVSDIWNPQEMKVAINGTKLNFKANAEKVRNYIAFDMQKTFPSPQLVGSVQNQNLHGGEPMDMIIVTHPNFLNQANELAQFHENEEEALKVKVVTPDEIYNEFSSGAPHVSAIRNYVRMWYDRTKNSSGTKLRYLLLMGDGSWDNKTQSSQNPNYILTYQSRESLLPTSSFVSDDFYGLLDEDDGESVGYLDVGVGRIPCSSTFEAQLVVDKIKNYASPAAFGDWRNRLTFMADDGDRNVHMKQAEILANQVGADYPSFIPNKIFFDAYQQQSTSAGQRYPEVNRAITKAVTDGTLILNYTGHAGFRGMADEQVLEIGEIDSWTNFNKLPIFVTATCEFSRFDLKETMSAGEHILMNPKGGGIALFSTTRVVYSGPNFNLNKWFYKFVFEQDENGNNYRMGDIMRLTKVASGGGTNKRNFTLLGDPALRITYPRYHIKTTYMNGDTDSENIPGLKALSEVEVKGEITDHRGEILTDFNGNITPLVFDKSQDRFTLANDGGDPFEFSVRENILFKGGASVADGEFNFSFMVPKDISYNEGTGRICYYAHSDNADANGYWEDFTIGGGTEKGVDDNTGPEIALYMNDTTFVSGGNVNETPWLIAYINDQNGINTVGAGIGHDITATIDGNNIDVIILNNYFQSDKDKFNSGKIVFPISGLEEGHHTLKLKVWDVLNNSSEQEIDFVVTDELGIKSLSCYPNPAETATVFKIIHNSPGEVLDVKIRIFSSSGVQVDEIETQAYSNGIECEPIQWDFSSKNIWNGIYYYQAVVTNSSGVYESETRRLVINRK